MGRAILLMISNNNLALRELYTVVLNNDLPRWRTSFMTALPEREGEIMSGYNLVIYELGKADDPRRIEIVRALGDGLRQTTNSMVYTHLEGLVPENVVADLAAHNVQAATGPVSWQGLSADLTRIATALAGPAPEKAAPAAATDGGLRGRLGGLLRRGGPRDDAGRRHPPPEGTSR